MPGLAQFSKIAPYLVNPLVLIGFCLCLVFTIHWTVVRYKLSKLNQRQSSTLLRGMLKYEFVLAVVLIVLGFLYAFRAYDRATPKEAKGPLVQQSGTCSANTVGDNNQINVDCTNKDGGTKQK